VLMDVAPRLGCVCSGAIPGTPPREARPAVVALEPPRSTAPVVEEQTPLDLDLPIPAVPRTPVDVVLATRTPSSPLALPTPSTPVGSRSTPTVTEPRVPRSPSPPPPRPISGSVPTARHSDGKALPRAYVARRRSSAPKGNPVVPPHQEVAPNEPAPAAQTPGATTTASLESPPPEAAARGAVADEKTSPATPREDISATETSQAATSAEKQTATPASAAPATNGAELQQITPPADGAPTPESVVDIDQLHLDGIAPPLERLPIFTPTPSSVPTQEATPAPKAAGTPTQATPTTMPAHRQSRFVVYALVAAVALLLVAGVAYFIGRSEQSPNAPTGQLP